MLQKIYNITNKRKNKINEPEKHVVTKYENILNGHMKELEDKIKIMKMGYLQALIEKHFEKDENKKKEIILKGNIPKKRNDVKKVFKKLMALINDKLSDEHKKYCYMKILEILDKYKNIQDKEKKDMMKLFKQKIKNKSINKNNKKINNNKMNDNVYKKDKDDDNDWINQKNSSKGITFKLFTVLIPLAYIINYAYANFKV